MPIKINELVIQVKVYESNKQVDNAKNMPANCLAHTTEQQIAFTKDVINDVLDDREAR